MAYSSASCNTVPSEGAYLTMGGRVDRHVLHTGCSMLYSVAFGVVHIHGIPVWPCHQATTCARRVSNTLGGDGGEGGGGGYITCLPTSSSLLVS